jgi:molecular chaperone Hsp33
MNDYMLRIFAKETGLRGLVCVTSDLAREAARRHSATPLAAAALSHGLTAAALLGGLLKARQRVALKIEADGPLRKLVAEADASGRVRGYVAGPDLAGPPPFGPNVVGEALGRQGLLTVVKDLGLRDLYQGAVALQGDHLDASLIHYFAKSEQVASLIQLGAALDDAGGLLAAGGLLFQLLPGADPGVLQRVGDNLAHLPPVAAFLSAGHTPEEVAAQAMNGMAYAPLEQQPLAFSCSCSRTRSRQALKVLGEDDLLALIVEGEAVVDCHFCHERYVFGREELGEILDEIEMEAVASLFDDDQAADEV